MANVCTSGITILPQSIGNCDLCCVFNATFNNI